MGRWARPSPPPTRAKAPALLLVARRAAPLEALAAELGVAVPGAEVAVCAADLVTAEGAAAMAAAAVERFGRLDVLYNNLGDSAFGSVPPHEVTGEAWAYLLRINLEAAFLCTRAVLPAMLARRKGSIIHVSAAERVRLRANPGYAAAKAGLVELCRRLARAYRDDGVRVNCICPGGMGDDVAAASIPPTRARPRCPPGGRRRRRRLFRLGRVRLGDRSDPGSRRRQGPLAAGPPSPRLGRPSRPRLPFPGGTSTGCDCRSRRDTSTSGDYHSPGGTRWALSQR